MLPTVRAILREVIDARAPHLAHSPRWPRRPGAAELRPRPPC
jgi:hypothetical protein